MQNRLHWAPVNHPCLAAHQDLGAAALSKRPTSCLLILPKPIKAGEVDEEETKEFEEAYGEVEKKLKAAQVVY